MVRTRGVRVISLFLQALTPTRPASLADTSCAGRPPPFRGRFVPGSPPSFPPPARGRTTRLNGAPFSRDRWGSACHDPQCYKPFYLAPRKCRNILVPASSVGMIRNEGFRRKEGTVMISTESLRPLSSAPSTASASLSRPSLRNASA